MSSESEIAIRLRRAKYANVVVLLQYALRLSEKITKTVASRPKWLAQPIFWQISRGCAQGEICIRACFVAMSMCSHLISWQCVQGGEDSQDPREILGWIRMTRTAWQDARRSGKEDAGHSLFLEECLFGFYREHNSKIRKGSCRDVTWRDLVVTWRLIRDWNYLLTFRVSLEKLARAEHSK